MGRLSLAIAQLEVVRGDPAANLRAVSELAADAAGSGADVLCLPEMFTTGFDWDGICRLRSVAADGIAQLSLIARENRIAICGSVFEAVDGGGTANTFHYFDATGACLAKYRKAHLFSPFNEQRHLRAGGVSCAFAADWGRAAAGICYDLRFPELFRGGAAAGAQVLFRPSAFPEPREDHWRTLVRARAIENQFYMVAVNQCGCEGGAGARIRYFGRSMVVDPWGEIVFEGGDAAGLGTVDIDLDLVGEVRRRLPALADRRPEVYSRPPSDGR